MGRYRRIRVYQVTVVHLQRPMHLWVSHFEAEEATRSAAAERGVSEASSERETVTYPCLRLELILVCLHLSRVRR